MNPNIYLFGGIAIGILTIFFLITLIFMNTLRMYNQTILYENNYTQHEEVIKTNKENVANNFQMINDIKNTIDDLEDNIESSIDAEIADITTSIQSLKSKDSDFEDIHLEFNRQFDNMILTQQEDHNELEGIINNKLMYSDVSEENSEIINKLEDEIQSTEDTLSGLHKTLQNVHLYNS